MQDEEVVQKEERFPLSAEEANRSARCPICGRAVDALTEAQKEYASAGHPLLCYWHLEARTAARIKFKARMKKEREARRVPGLLEQDIRRLQG